MGRLTVGHCTSSLVARFIGFAFCVLRERERTPLQAWQFVSPPADSNPFIMVDGASNLLPPKNAPVGCFSNALFSEPISGFFKKGVVV